MEEPLGHENIVKLLLAAGADPNSLGAVPFSALHWAAQAGNPKILKLFLEAGAEVNPVPSDRPGLESTLKLAVENRREKAVRLLLAAGANPNLGDNSKSGSPLRCAIRKKEPVIEQMLRDHGAIDFIGTPPASP